MRGIAQERDIAPLDYSLKEQTDRVTERHMTIGALVSFGGVLLVGAIAFGICLILIRKLHAVERAGVQGEASELANAAARAHRLAKQLETELAELRDTIAS